MNDPIAGYTKEGYEVPTGGRAKLSFTLVAFEWFKDSNPFSGAIAIEHNQTVDGKKKPYLVINLGKLMIQSGWLF